MVVDGVKNSIKSAVGSTLFLWRLIVLLVAVIYTGILLVIAIICSVVRASRRKASGEVFV
jgi:hypothetical protein